MVDRARCMSLIIDEKAAETVGDTSTLLPCTQRVEQPAATMLSTADDKRSPRGRRGRRPASMTNMAPASGGSSTAAGHHPCRLYARIAAAHYYGSPQHRDP